MERSVFSEHLAVAAAALRSATTRHVIERLPEPLLFQVNLSCSFDGNALLDDERVFAQDLAASRPLGPLTQGDVIDLLWRDGWVPEWIDMIVVSADTNHTTIQMDCCGRFTTGSHLYHQQWKPPFSIKVGPIPPDLKEGERYSLYWRTRQAR